MSGAPGAAALPGELVGFALEHLPSMRLPASGLYCFDWPHGGGALRGESHRYSLMVLLGEQRAAAAGLDVPDDLEALYERCLARRAAFTPGDLGLALWADSRRGGDDGAKLVEEIERAVPDDRALAPLVGMEIAWLVLGLAHAAAGGAEASASAADTGRRVLRHLRGRRLAPSGLAYHDDASRLRRRLPNFATQIYAVQALAVAAATGLAADARADAERLAGRLLELQLPDGGWPWLFDAERGTVAERYEVYSVHQDAMAPMALHELTDLTGDPSYRAAAVRGLAWSHGRNELGADLFDRHGGFAHRSIRRRRPLDRLLLAANAATTLAAGRPVVATGGARVELDRTCRPYHLGWILEAWAGREHLTGVSTDA